MKVEETLDPFNWTQVQEFRIRHRGDCTVSSLSCFSDYVMPRHPQSVICFLIVLMLSFSSGDSSAEAQNSFIAEKRKVETFASQCADSATRGDYHAAEVALRAGLSALDSIQDWPVRDATSVAILSCLTLTLSNQGKFAESLQAATQWAAAAERSFGTADPRTVESLVFLGFARRAVGEIAAAAETFLDALVAAEQAFATDDARVVNPLLGFGVVVSNADPQLAESVLHKALKIAQANGNHCSLTVGAYAALGKFYFDQKRYSEAEPNLTQAVLCYRNLLGRNSPVTALTTLALAENRVAQGKNEGVKALALGARITLGENSPFEQQALMVSAKIAAMENDYPGAEALLRQAVASSQRLGFNYSEAPLNSLSFILTQQGKVDEALLISRSIAQKNKPSVAHLLVINKARKKGRLDPKEAASQSFSVLQHIRSRRTSGLQASTSLAVSEVRSRRDILPILDAIRSHQRMLVQLREVTNSLWKELGASNPQRGRISALKGQKDALARAYDEAEVKLRASSPSYLQLRSKVGKTTLTFAQVQSLLGEDEALIVIDWNNKNDFSGRNHSFAWAITAESAEWHEITLPHTEVENAVKSLRSQIGNGSFRGATILTDEKAVDHRGPPRGPPLSYILYRDILGPLEHVFGAKKKLLTVVDGPLASIPLGVLTTANENDSEVAPWLIRRFAVSVLPSVESLEYPAVDRVAASKPVRAYGNPIFQSGNQSQQANIYSADIDNFYRGGLGDPAAIAAYFPKLPDTEVEVTQVARYLDAPSEDVLLGAGATESDVKGAALDQYRVLYFATHGLIAGDRASGSSPLNEPALVLTLPALPTDEDDGLLTASEIARLNLNAELVVLSACNTALGSNIGAEPLSGLASAFLLAGARSLLVSHWAVESRATAHLLITVFSKLDDDPSRDVSVALQQTMLEMLDDPKHPEWASPWIWAPFTVVGRYQKVH